MLSRSVFPSDGSGDKEVLAWTYSARLPFPLLPFLSVHCQRVWGAVSSLSGFGAEPRAQTHVCDILSLENRFGGNKTVSVYDSHHKEVAVWFQAGQRSAGMPYQHILSPFQQWFLNVI